MGEDGEEGGDLDLHVPGLQAVVVEPLAEEPARGEPRERRLVELAGEEVRDPGDPRVRRLREDHVVAARRAEEVVARVAEGDAEARVVLQAVR